MREIRGVDQRDPQRVKRWFQDDYFDLYIWQDGTWTELGPETHAPEGAAP